MPLILALLLCLASGVLLEALFAVGHNLSGAALFTAGATVQRSLEVGAFALCAGVVGAALGALITRIRAARTKEALPSAFPASLAAAFGTLACVWLVAGFWIAAPTADEIQATTDPFRLRAASLIGGAIVCALLVIPWRRALAHLRAVHVAATGGAAAVGLVAALATSAGAAVPSGRELHMLTVDTLRTDRLGCYGGPTQTSPHLDQLCAESLVFEHAFTAVPETIPSYSTIYTGLHPLDHGVLNNFLRLSDDVETVAERLSAQGYRTVAILEGTFPGTFGNLDQGFDIIIQRGVVVRSPAYSPNDAVRSVVDATRSLVFERFLWSDSITSAASERWLAALGGPKPLFTHIYWPYPHAPFTPRPEHSALVAEPTGTGKVASQRRAYDAEIHFTDAMIARTLRALAQRPESARALWLFTADHGEELGRSVAELPEPFFGHSRYLNDSSTRVSLMVRMPADSGVAPGRRHDLVWTGQVAATLLKAAGLEPGARMTPALPLTAEGGEATIAMIMRSGKLDRVGIRDATHLLVETRAPKPALELFEYGAMGEQVLDPAAEPELTRRLRDLLLVRFPVDADSTTRDQEPELSDRQMRLLRSLGYTR